MIPLHTPVSFSISIRRGKEARCIHLAGEGKIVRLERAENNREVAIAVECDVRIAHLEESLTSYPAKLTCCSAYSNLTCFSSKYGVPEQACEVGARVSGLEKK